MLAAVGLRGWGRRPGRSAGQAAAGAGHDCLAGRGPLFAGSLLREERHPAVPGATLEDLATIAAAAIEQWRSAQPDPDGDFDIRDRHLTLGLTFSGAGMTRGDLTPECAAVLQALRKKRGREDDRSEANTIHPFSEGNGRAGPDGVFSDAPDSGKTCSVRYRT